jgi:ClpP class serine protease
MGSGLEAEAREGVARFTKLQELLDGVDRAADEAEGVLGCRVIVLAFHELASVDRDVVDDLEFYVRERGLQKGMDVCIVLHTSGGDADAAYHIGVRLQRLVEGGRLIVAVPRLAKSAGILMACAGDEICATPITELGPVDPQVFISSTGRYVSARTVRDSLRQVIETIEEAVRAAKAISQQMVQAIVSSIPIAEMGHFESLSDHVRSLLEEILSERMKRGQDRAKISEIAERLTKGYKYHGKVIHVDEATEIGLSMKVLEGRELDAMYNLYGKLKELLDAVDELIEPLLYRAQIPTPIPPPSRPYKIKHGLIYLPSLEDWARMFAHAEAA